MVFFYCIIRDYYLPLRTGTISADLLGWLLYIVYARALTLYIERKNICPRRQSITDTDLQADAYIDLQADAYIDLQADAYIDSQADA